MKYLGLPIIVCLASIGAAAFQGTGKIEPPIASEVAKIETTDNTYRFYTPSSLLRILPQLTASEHGSLKPAGYQYGTITLKNGEIVKWKSSHFGNLILYGEGSEQFFVEQDPFLDRNIGPLTFTLVSFVLFGLLLVYFLGQRDQSEIDLTSAPALTRQGRWKRVLVRIAAFVVFAFLAYLTLRLPLQRISDGAFLESPGRFDSRWVMVFADTDPRTFWLHVGGGIVVAMIPLSFGLFFLMVNPKRFIRARKRTIDAG